MYRSDFLVALQARGVSYVYSSRPQARRRLSPAAAVGRKCMYVPYNFSVKRAEVRHKREDGFCSLFSDVGWIHDVILYHRQGDELQRKAVVPRLRVCVFYVLHKPVRTENPKNKWKMGQHRQTSHIVLCINKYWTNNE
jgi:hypothetical protein